MRCSGAGGGREVYLGCRVGRRQRRFAFSLSPSFTSCFLRGDVLSVTFHSFQLAPETFFFFLGNAIFVETDHEHIPDSSLSVLLFSPDSCLLRRYNMCLVLADSHVYKVHICVHMCNTRYSSNLLLWLLLMMILVPFLKFQPVFWFFVCLFCLFFVPLLVLICCWWIVLQEPKKGRWLLWIFTLSFISGVCGHFNEALFFYYSRRNVVMLTLITCFSVFFCCFF